MQNKNKHTQKEKLLSVPKFLRVCDAYVGVVHVTKTQLFSVKIKGISENEVLLVLSAPCVYFNQRFFSIHRYDKGKRLWRVVHSMHASMEEVLQPSVANS